MASSSSSSPELPAATYTETLPRFSYKDATHEDVLEDLSSRFILNLPDHELSSLERLCFQVEQAHWFYEDFIREENPKFPSLPLKKFSAMLFHACPLLQQWSHDHEQAFNQFMAYKTRVPVCGAIMLNDTMEKCLLVKGWKSSSGWGFPKGKINETEPPPTCAVREVLEETGYNLAGQIDPQHVIEMSIKEQKISLFIVPGVPEDFPFKTKTRKEISKIEWFRLTDLPTWRRKNTPPGKFYLITPFISPLKNFINERKPRNNPRKGAKPKKNQPPPASPQLHRNEGSSHVNGTLQESSSQSSVDNAGPQTPSPRRSEASINPAPEVEGNQLEPLVSHTAMDPHFARLLSNLTLSAASVPEVRVGDKGTHAARHEVNSIDSSALRSDTSDDSPIATHAPDQSANWSSSVPASHVLSQSSLSYGTHESSMDLPRSNTSNSTRPRPRANPFEVHVEQDIPRQDHNHTAYTTSAPTSPSTQAPRRASSTADISPYLTRAAEVPTSAKRLQQLSLLESVANESARMAPMIAARAAIIGANPAANGYHLPPHQGMMHQNPRDLGVIYSSGYPPHPSNSAAGFHPMYPHTENPMHGQHDPFQVRSRTSQAFHRAPMHHPTASISHINQNRLLAAMNGSRATPISPNHQYGQQFVPQQLYPQMYTPTPAFHDGPIHPHYHPAPPVAPAFTPLPHMPTRVGPHPYPTVNPNLAPAMHNSLLSILNTRREQQPIIPAQVHQ